MHSNDSSNGREQASRDGDPWQLEDLDCALMRSRETSQPIFFYWGTKWCPPCWEMHGTVLKRQGFQDRSARMVTVGIDGDAQGAQAWGERLGIDVYPSMLIVDRDEREWIRLPCGLEEAQFCAVIDTAMRRRAPMDRLAAALDGSSSTLTDDEATLLAFHYWPQERRIASGASRLNFLARLDAAIQGRGSPLEARVLVWQIIERAGVMYGDLAVTSEHRLYERLLALLASSEATFSTLYYLLVSLQSFVACLSQDDALKKVTLIESLSRVADTFTSDSSLSWTERLIAQSALVTLATGEKDSDIPANLRARARARVRAADSETTEPGARQSVMNMAGHLLRQVGLFEESIQLFCRQIEQSPWPTYFMPYVADMLMEQGNQDEAFGFWRRAYEETSGKNTRFELGVRYLAALVRHVPEERAKIEGLVTRILAERADDAELTCARMRKSLGTLARTLAQWRK